MNILYCGDRGIESGVLISVLSLAKHAPDPLHIFLLTMDFSNKKSHFLPISERYRRGLERILQGKNPASTVQLIDATPLFNACPPTANQNSRFTPGCMLRLYADQVPELPDRILYLDNDVVAHADPTVFYNLDLTGHEVAGVLDNYGAHFFQNKPRREKEYLNSGVLLLNLALIRETGLFAAARAKCHSEKMLMPDQTALNRLCKTKLILGREYNEQARTKHNTVFRHFTTTFQPIPYPHPQTIKPWHISALHDKLKEYAYDDILAEYEPLIQEIKDV